MNKRVDWRKRHETEIAAKKRRNRSVLRALARGMKQSEIARRFGLSRQRIWAIKEDAAKASEERA